MEKLFEKDFGIARNNCELIQIQKNNSDYDSEYVTASCAYNRRDTKDWLENLWKKYQTYAEPRFLDKISKNSFHAHSWEMYIGVVLINNGFNLIQNDGIGPDIKFKISRSKIAWVEATVTTSGDQKDSSGIPASGSIYKLLDPRVSRITQSLTKKYCKFLKKDKNKIVKEKFIFWSKLKSF